MQGGRAGGGGVNSSSAKLSSSPSHTSNVLSHHPTRKSSMEIKRASPSPLVTTKNEDNYMAMDFGEKSSSTVNSFSQRRPSSGSSPNVENQRRLTLERIEGSTSTSGEHVQKSKLDKGSTGTSNEHAQKSSPTATASATSSNTVSATSKSRLKQLGNKFNAKFHLKMPTASSAGGEPQVLVGITEFRSRF